MAPGCRIQPGGRCGRAFSRGFRSSSFPKAASYAAAGSPIRTPVPFVPNASCNCPGSRILSAPFVAGLRPPVICRFRIGRKIQRLRDPACRAGGRGPSITRPARGDRTPEPEDVDPPLQVFRPPQAGASSGVPARGSLPGADQSIFPFLAGTAAQSIFPFPSSAQEKTGIRPDSPADSNLGPTTGPSAVPGPSQVASDPAPVRTRPEGSQEERAQRLPAPAGEANLRSRSGAGGRHPDHGRHLPRDLKGPPAGRPRRSNPGPDGSPGTIAAGKPGSGDWSGDFLVAD